MSSPTGLTGEFRTMLEKFCLSMKCGIASIVIGAAMTSPAAADSLLFQYCAFLSSKDLYTSSGARLTKFGDVLAQDRANFHRFGVRQQFDYDDPGFHTKSARANIPQLYKNGPGASASIKRQVMNGSGYPVCVDVMGRSGRPTYLVVFEGAG